MADLVLLVIVVAATLYAVLGGADFGVGVIEAFVGDKESHTIDVAMAPVWEANHVWLVLIVVLTFVGFPEVYAVSTTYLHIPLVLALLGIVARGTAFTFRHYDPRPGALGDVYTVLFRVSSMLTPLFLGVTAAALVEGDLTRADGKTFYEAYVAPWNTPFCYTTGLFVVALFTFQGAALLAAETAGKVGPLPYIRVTRYAHFAAFVCGALTLGTAYTQQSPWLDGLLASPTALACMGLATLLVPAVALAFRRGKPWLLRGAMAAQVASIVVGFFAAQFPVLVRLQPENLTVQSAAAPDATLRALLVAVGVGLLLIVPAMIYLVVIHKRPQAGG